MGKNKKGETDRCAFPHCRQLSDFIWLGVGVCNHHFEWICNNPIEKAYKKFEVAAQKIKDNSEPCGCNGKKNKKGLEHFTKD